MKPTDILLPLLVLLVAGAILFLSLSKNPLRKATITTKEGAIIPLDVELADNATSRARGLMGRQVLPECSGMLFVFDEPGRHAFWMLNTSIPLEAVHILADGSISQIIPMEPCGMNPLSCPNYPPEKESLYVLELNQGFCSRHGIAPGDRFVLGPTG